MSNTHKIVLSWIGAFVLLAILSMNTHENDVNEPHEPHTERWDWAKR